MLGCCTNEQDNRDNAVLILYAKQQLSTLLGWEMNPHKFWVYVQFSTNPDSEYGSLWSTAKAYSYYTHYSTMER